jgi:conjugal transfer pilus assembly protein TraW
MPLLLLGFCIPYGESLAGNLGVQGSIYEIGEQDALEMIKKRLTVMEKNGEIEIQNQKLKKQALSSIERPAAVSRLKPTTKPRVFEKDLSLTVPEDIKGAQNEVLYKAGTKINPLQGISTKKSLIFLDGDDQKQLNWALQAYRNRKEFAKLVLVNGSPLELMRQYEIPFYFDQAGRLSQYFKLEQIPALIYQKNDRLIISEVKL